jgi:hypothetical protein
VQHPGTSGWGEEDYTTEGTSAYDVNNSYAIRMSRVRDGWIKNVQHLPACGQYHHDASFKQWHPAQECSRVTVKSCHFRRPQYGGGGGAGYMYRLQNSGDCLVRDSTAEFCRHGFVFSHMASSGNVLHACLDKTTGKQTATRAIKTPPAKAATTTCTSAIRTWWMPARRTAAGSRPATGPLAAVLHNLTAAHCVFWNTEGKGTAASYVVHSQQSRYGYVIGTRGTLTAVNTGGSSTAKTAPVDHVEGTALGGTLTPFSLFREQRRRRLGLPTVDAVAERRCFSRKTQRWCRHRYGSAIPRRCRQTQPSPGHARVVLERRICKVRAGLR